jgi:hypothetical protein
MKRRAVSWEVDILEYNRLHNITVPHIQAYLEYDPSIIMGDVRAHIQKAMDWSDWGSQIVIKLKVFRKGAELYSWQHPNLESLVGPAKRSPRIPNPGVKLARLYSLVEDPRFNPSFRYLVYPELSMSYTPSSQAAYEVPLMTGYEVLEEIKTLEAAQNRYGIDPSDPYSTFRRR